MHIKSTSKQLQTGLYSFASRKRKLLISLLGIFILYSLAGFFLAPWYAGKTLQQMVAARLDLQLSYDKLRFNPYTFTIEIQNLELAESSGIKPLSFTRLFINYEPHRLLTGKFRFGEISLTSPSIQIERYSETDNTIARLIQSWASTAEVDQAPAENSQDGSMPVIEITHFAYIEGSLLFNDYTPSETFSTSIDPINIMLDDFSTAPEEIGTNQIVLTFENQARVTWSGDYSVSPPSLNGHLELQDFNLARPYQYLSDLSSVALERALVSLQADYQIKLLEQAVDISVNNFNLDITQIEVQEEITDSPLIENGQIKLRNGRLSTADSMFHIDNLVLSDAVFSLARMENGEINLLAALNTPETAMQADPAESTGATPGADSWTLALDNFSIEQTRFLFNDLVPQSNAMINLDIELAATGFTNLADNRTSFESNIMVANTGTIQMIGDIALFPAVDLTSTLNLSAIPVNLAEPYLNEFSNIAIPSGSLNLQSEISSSSEDLFALDGELLLETLVIQDQIKNEELFRLQGAEITDLNFSMAQNSLNISSILLNEAYARIIINDDGSSNISRTLKPASEAATSNKDDAVSTEPDNSPAFMVSIAQVRFENAMSDFTDLNLPIIFQTRMAELSGQLDGFNNNSSQPSELALEGTVDDFGLARVDGNFYPLDFTRQSTIDLQFDNLEMPGVNPYMIKFAGRELVSGRMDVQLGYSIVDNVLDASNNIVIRDIELGEKVPHPDAMDLPLDLAIALLEDNQGIIEVDVPVSGNLDDPEFSLGPAIRRAFANIIVNIVSAPFRLLGSLLGLDDEEMEDLDLVRFLPGRADLTPPEREKIELLVEALTLREGLDLLILPAYATESDTLALKEQLLTMQVEQGINAIEDEISREQKQQQVLEQLYQQANIQPAITDARLTFMQSTEESGETLDTFAWISFMQEQLVDIQPVAEPELLTLAEQRVTSIRQLILQSGQVAAERIELGEFIDPGLNDGWVETKLEIVLKETAQ